MIFVAVLIFSLATSWVHVSAEQKHQQEDDDLTFYWRRSNPPRPCKPFTTFMDECNKCVCAAEGIPYCTRMDCPKKVVPTKKDNSYQKVLGTPKDNTEMDFMMKRLLKRHN